MNIKLNKSYGVVSTTVEFNNLEMRQVAKMSDRIECILSSHKNEKVKNEYLNDDELEMCHIILSVISREYKDTEVSAFDEALAKLNTSSKPEEKPQPDGTDEDDE